MMLLMTSCGVTKWDIAINDSAASQLAKPSEIQYNWQEMERGMFHTNWIRLLYRVENMIMGLLQ